MTVSPIDGDTNAVRVNDRAIRALDLYRDGGVSWESVAQLTGFRDRTSCYRAVMRLLHNHATASAAELRKGANARTAAKLAMLEETMYDLDADPMVRIRAVEAHTRAEARHARLNGLDAPVQIAVGAGTLAELDDALALLDSVVKGEVVESHDLGSDDAGAGTGDGASGGSERDDRG